MNNVNKTRGARKIIKSLKKEGSPVKACQQCKNPINVGDIYYNFGLRPSTLVEKQYSRKGQVWYQYCEKCA